MIEKFLKQAKREYSPGKRIILLIFGGIFFLGILPGSLAYFSSLLDRQLKLPLFAFGAINIILGCGFIAAGILFAWWSIYAQFTLGRGTPIPIMATQELIIQKPYNYCRNPMALGALVVYLGVATLRGSISALAIVIAISVLLLVYIKFVEEKEMELRFGAPYRVYREQTPFIIPRFRQKK